MAQAWVNHLCGGDLKAQSAGLEPGVLNPLAVQVMREVGIAIESNETKSVFDLYKSGALFQYVITVCDEASAERCPIFPGVLTQIHWSFADPAAFEGTMEERLERTRAVRDAIKMQVDAWCSGVCASPRLT
jgi:arsenate reductase (thioredoxin)